MEELSDLNFLLGRPQIQELEVEASLDALPTMTVNPQGVLPLVGPDVLHGFARKGNGFEFVGTTPEEASWWAEKLCQYMKIDPGDDAMAALNRRMIRQLVTGPDDHNDPELVKFGYTLDVWRKMLAKRTDHENDLVRLLDKNPDERQGQLRDLIGWREMEIELGDLLARITIASGASLTQLLEIDDPKSQESRAKIRNFSDGMPSTRVAVSMKERYHRDSRHEWTANDIQDIDAAAIAVPYCDAVFIDKAARNQVVSSPELRIFGTELPRRPQELTDWLGTLSPR
jgi:hypothetical protein